MVSVFLQLLCWVSVPLVALVTLRKGPTTGGLVFICALVPAGLLYYLYGDSGSLALLFGTTVLAWLLRATVNLPLAVLASVGVGFLTGLSLIAFSGAYLEQMVSVWGEVLSNLEQQLAQGDQAVQLPRPQTGQIAGMIGAGTATISVVCLLLARYWQATLYNPGGFGQEFRALYYPVWASLALVFAALVFSSLGQQYGTWAMICLLPLTFAGLALVHARAALRGRGAGWLTGFYLVWVIFDPVKLLVVFLAIADSWFNFRQRWARQAGKAVSRPDEQDD